MSKASIVNLILIFVLSACACSALAHHSRVHYGRDTVEMNGEIVDVRWANPHIMFYIQTTDNNGLETVWELEAGSIYALTRGTDIKAEYFNIGDRVQFAGRPSRSIPDAMLVSNILLPNGKEILLLPNTEPRWPDKGLAVSEKAPDNVLDNNKERSLFHVWSTDPSRSRSGEGPIPALLIPPLNEAGKARLEEFKATGVDPETLCEKPGMPSTMFTPQPIAFTDNGDHIQLDIQENDITRKIWMPENETVSADFSIQGYSVGRWDGTTLEVRTTNISYPLFNGVGVPLSKDAVVVERFEISEDGSRMDANMVTVDPSHFLEPVHSSQLYALLGEKISEFNCVPLDREQ